MSEQLIFITFFTPYSLKYQSNFVNLQNQTSIEGLCFFRRISFYWELGRDIVEKKEESRWGSGFMKNLSRDLKEVNPDATCFSETNLLYMKNFYLLYQPYLTITPQVVEQITQKAVEQKENAITPQLVGQIQNDLFSVPWGHHRFIIDNNRCKELSSNHYLFWII